MAFVASVAEQIRAVIPPDCPLPVEIHCQDEARFGLMTTQRRRITARGVKPVGTCQHAYANSWCFSTVAPAKRSLRFERACRGTWDQAERVYERSADVYHR